MKKILLTLLLTSVSGFSQISLGIKGNIAVQKISEISGKNNAVFSFTYQDYYTPFIGYSFGKRFGVQVEYNTKKYNIEYTNSDGTKGVNLKGNYIFRHHEIPVFFQYVFNPDSDINFYAQLGASFKIRENGSVLNYTNLGATTPEEKKISGSENVDKNFEKIVYALNAVGGARYYFTENLFALGELRWSRDLSNLANSNSKIDSVNDYIKAVKDTKMDYLTLHFGVGYKF